MKRLILMLGLLFIIYFGIQFGFQYFGHGHDITYQVKSKDTTLQIHEVLTARIKDETDNYYFEISTPYNVFTFQTTKDYKKSKEIIKEIAYYKDDVYECIYPIFPKKKSLVDILCRSGANTSFYHNLKGRSNGVDGFAESLVEKGYKIEQFTDNKKDSKVNGPVTVYPKNVLEDHFVAINNYKGLYTINNYNFDTIADIKVFTKDIYQRPISLALGKYYVTANYDQDFYYDKFYIVDLMYNETDYIKTERDLSKDVYVQGTNHNSVFFIDPSSKKQYEMNIKDKTFIEVGNTALGYRVYKNGEWVKETSSKKEDLLFQEKSNQSQNKNYVRIDKIGNQKSGYYYYYKKSGSNYEAYRASVQTPNNITYLFTTNKINDIAYRDDYVYFSSNNEVKYFHNTTGVRTVFTNREFEFNKSLTYYIYLNH